MLGLGSCLVLLCLCWSSIVVLGEVFTAMTELEDLLHSERRVVQTLEEYLVAEQERLEKIRKYTNEFKELYVVANDNFEKFISHPVNVYLFIKRLTSDWKDAEEQMNMQLGREYLDNIYKLRSALAFPTDEDLTGVAVALSRLQDTYRLDSDLIAAGKIKGVLRSPQLNVAECFELGRVLYNFKDYDHSMNWMTTALHRLDYVDLGNSTVTKADVLEYLAFSSYMKGDIKQALKYTNQLLDHSPEHERARNNVWHYERELLGKTQGRKRGDDGDTVLSNKKLIENRTNNWTDERRAYEVLCRGRKELKPSMQRVLKCFYTADHPFLKLQPIKSEVLYPDPRIVLYYDVLMDEEILRIKALAAPRLQRATVQNALTGELETAHYRISKSAWLNKNDDPVVERVNNRISYITGLDMDFAEELQIANYGIGGHYEPHFDFARKAESKAFTSLGMGNRLATFLFYMSDVEAGGATVFPRLNLAMWPKKGAAAFWYNLYKNGEGDVRTRHAACPVLSGVKWVSNKWIHEYGQEFNHPCGGLPDGYEPEDAVL